MEQEKLIHPTGGNTFYEEVRKLPEMKERTGALILKIMPKSPGGLRSQFLTKRVRKEANEHDFTVLGSLNSAYRDLREKDLLRRIENLHKYTLTPLGSLATQSDEKILQVFRPPVKKIEDELFERANSVIDDAILEDNENFAIENKRLRGEIDELKEKEAKKEKFRLVVIRGSECYKKIVSYLQSEFDGKGEFDNYALNAIHLLKEYKKNKESPEKDKAAEEDLAKQLLVVSDLRNALTIAFREYNRDLPVKGARL